MELPPPSKPSFMSKLKTKLQKSSSKADQPPPPQPSPPQTPQQLDYPRLETPRLHDTSSQHDVSFGSQTQLHSGGGGGGGGGMANKSSLNVTARRIYTTAALYLSPAPAPPRTVNQYGEPMAILNPEPAKSLCRFSMFLNVVLVLGFLAGIVLTACGGINETAAIVGPCFIVLSVFAMCGKAYVTLLYTADPLPFVSKYTHKLDERLDKVDWKLPKFVTRATGGQSKGKGSAPPPPPSWLTFEPGAPPGGSQSETTTEPAYNYQGYTESNSSHEDYNLELGPPIPMTTIVEHGSGSSSPTFKYSDDQI